MRRRIEIYPTVAIAKYEMDQLSKNNTVSYYNRPSLELTLDGMHYIFLTRRERFRGYMYDEIYIHPNCSNRLELILEGLTRGAKIVYKGDVL